ncbi:MAG: enoyl-CoA hydratase/isomerase family protein [Pseudomonadota bacterium]|jgi:methylglutaconyl-CoA hydratase
MTGYSHISVHIEKHIATVTINRPEARNALNMKTIGELTTAFTGLSIDPAVRCVLLRGSGTEAFCAGADLQELNNAKSPATRREFFSAIATLVQAIQECAPPVVCIVYGFALAGGLGLVAASDIAIAADDAQFGLPEVAVGLAPLVVAAPLSKVVSGRGLSYLALSAERIGAAEALRIGLISRTVPKDIALNETLALCNVIAQRGPNAVRATKANLLELRTLSGKGCLHELADRSALVSLSDEANEGIQAFSEKRSPRWKNSTSK